MARMFVCDRTGVITADIDVNEPGLSQALDREEAGSVIGCAVLMALSTLAQGEGWPEAALESMAGFMDEMRQHVLHDRLN